MARINKKEVAEILGATMHTLLRKSFDSTTSSVLCNAISNMPDKEWHDLCYFTGEEVIADIKEQLRRKL